MKKYLKEFPIKLLASIRRSPRSQTKKWTAASVRTVKEVKTDYKQFSRRQKVLFVLGLMILFVALVCLWAVNSRPGELWFPLKQVIEASQGLRSDNLESTYKLVADRYKGYSSYANANDCVGLAVSYLELNNLLQVFRDRYAELPAEEKKAALSNLMEALGNGELKTDCELQDGLKYLSITLKIATNKLHEVEPDFKTDLSKLSEKIRTTKFNDQTQLDEVNALAAAANKASIGETKLDSLGIENVELMIAAAETLIEKGGDADVVSLPPMYASICLLVKPADNKCSQTVVESIVNSISVQSSASSSIIQAEKSIRTYLLLLGL